MTEQHDKQVVVVTGASAGVGRATVRAFARRGDDVALIARGEDGLEAARREVEQEGGRALVIAADVADPQAMLDAAERTENELGPITIWVNNAMASVFAPFWEVDHDEFRRVTEVTYHGYVNGTRAALKYMRPRDQGTIVMVGSALAYRSIPLQSAYCGAKAAIVGFTDSLRSELLYEQSNIKLTAVHLPAHNTPQFRLVRSKLPREAQPVPPIYQPELAADAIVWSTEHDRREIHLAAPALAAILGQKVVPELMDRYVVGAWEGQMIDEPRDEQRPDNLFAPVPGDHGAHGPFVEESRESSPVWWLDRNRGWVVAATAGIGAAVVAVAGAVRRGNNGG
jgi:short-subunit dehydrogenase